MALDDECAVMWEDRDKDFDFINAYVPIHDINNNRTLLVEYNDFEDEFFPIDEEFFNELHLYDLDLNDLQAKQLKKAFTEAVKKQKEE